MKYSKSIAAVVVLCLTGALFLNANVQERPPVGRNMMVSCNAFLATLTPEQKAKATFAFDDAERLNWHFIPRERKGLPLRELEGKAKKAALHFIHSALTEAGYVQTLDVMSLEEVLFLLESGDLEERRERRDPGKYYISIFGTPAAKGTWGWRLEGHHISLNFVITDGKVTSSTPEFFGANPGTIDAGVGRTLRVLGPEEDIARQILKACNDEQKALVLQDTTAPREIRNPGEAQPSQTPPVGLAASDMSPDQRKLLSQLLDEYLKNLDPQITDERRAAINKAGINKIYFAWWGQEEQHQPHYYRVQGPTFLIEYNNVQNNANHVHSVWRNMLGDFGLKP